MGVTEAHASHGEVIYYRAPALFRVLTSVALLDSAGGVSVAEVSFQTSRWLTVPVIFFLFLMFYGLFWAFYKLIGRGEKPRS